MTADPSIGEIIEAVVTNGTRKLSPEVANGLLQLKFDEKSISRIRNLLRKNNKGTISANERIRLENYLRVGRMLDLLHAKARLALSKSMVNGNV